MLAAAKVIIRLTGLNKYAFSSGECPAAPAFQATRLPIVKTGVGIAQVQSHSKQIESL